MLQSFFASSGAYQLQGAGNRDLYKLFCERYSHLVKQEGRLGVVLPRTAFLAEGAKRFRQWLFAHNTLRRLDLLLNNRGWAFTIHQQYTIALLTSQRHTPTDQASFQVTGPSANLSDFLISARRQGVEVGVSSLSENKALPLVPSQEHANVLAKMRKGVPFSELQDSTIVRSAVGKESIHALQELNETTHSYLFSHTQGVPVWKGRSFDQYQPHGNEPAGYAKWDEVFSFAQQKRMRSPVFKRMFSKEVLADPKTHPMNHCRIAFRDVTRSTDSRTVRACLVPPRVPLTNSAPYLVFAGWLPLSQASLLGVLNSTPFDWLARRYVEIHLNFYVLNSLTFPPTGQHALAAHRQVGGRAVLRGRSLLRVRGGSRSGVWVVDRAPSATTCGLR